MILYIYILHVRCKLKKGWWLLITRPTSKYAHIVQYIMQVADRKPTSSILIPGGRRGREADGVVYNILCRQDYPRVGQTRTPSRHLDIVRSVPFWFHLFFCNTHLMKKSFTL